MNSHMLAKLTPPKRPPVGHAIYYLQVVFPHSRALESITFPSPAETNPGSALHFHGNYPPRSRIWHLEQGCAARYHLTISFNTLNTLVLLLSAGCLS